MAVFTSTTLLKAQLNETVKKFIYMLIVLSMMACDSVSPSKKEPTPNGKSIESVSGQVTGHDYVDLGLPSGTKWATCNVGATKPTEKGDLFAWGETKPKEEYNWRTYKWNKNKKLSRYHIPEDLTKYVASPYFGSVDNKTVLEAADDAATANWGGAWRMPTKDDIKELNDGCTWVWTRDFNGSGVTGKVGTSKRNKNTIFLPAVYRRCDMDSDNTNIGYCYWTSSLHDRCSRNANDFYIIEDYGIMSSSNARYYGQSVRAVTK